MPGTAPAIDTTFRTATLLREALPQVDAVIADARGALREKVATGERISNAALEGEQHAAHTLSWIATYGECLREMSNWANRLSNDGKFGEMESLILQIGAGEYLAKLAIIGQAVGPVRHLTQTLTVCRDPAQRMGSVLLTLQRSIRNPLSGRDLFAKRAARIGNDGVDLGQCFAQQSGGVERRINSGCGVWHGANPGLCCSAS